MKISIQDQISETRKKVASLAENSSEELGCFKNLKHKIKLIPTHNLFKSRVNLYPFKIQDEQLLKDEINGMIENKTLDSLLHRLLPQRFFLKRKTM